MRRSLFWKILVGSWLSLILVAAGNALLFRVYASAVHPLGMEVIRNYGELELAAAAEVLEARGPTAAAEFLSRIPQQEGRTAILAGALGAPVRDPHASAVMSRVVRTPTGAYTLVFTSFGSRFFSVPPLLMRMPLHLLLIDLLAVSFFSFLVAQYLALPIQRLRFGLKRVAEGDLTVRLSQQLEGRRDEIAELASDFDAMAAQLEQLLESREQLLHHLSHEFRSPLTRLMLAVDLARQSPSRSLTSLERIEHEARRLDDMVGELLTLSRAEFTAAKSETYFDVADLVATVASDASFEASAKSVSVTAETTTAGNHLAGPTVLLGDAELLRKGLENVVRNSVRVSPSNAAVTVRMSALPGRVRIEVSDEGPGVPERDLERMFEPFVRLDGEAEGSGFGLGLAIARSAAAAHDGAIWAQNRRPRGLTVVFEFPIRADAHELAKVAQGQTA